MSNDVAQARVQLHELQKLIGDEHETVALFLLRLMEFEREKMHERLGYASMWDFCRRGLGLAESTINRRLKAIRLVERFPMVVDYLRDGRLCTTRMLMLFDALTPENAIDLFDQASRKSMKEIELLVATARPQPAPPVRIQKLPEARTVVEKVPALSFGTAPVIAEPIAARPSLEPTACAAPAPVRRRTEIHPTSAQQYVARLPLSRAFVQKLEMAKKLGSHVVPTHDPVAILELALDLFIEKHGKRRGAIAVKRPRTNIRQPIVQPRKMENVLVAAEPAQERAPKRQHFTVEQLRVIWMRDGGRCMWPLDGGGHCGSEWQIEVDHVRSVARGGSSDPDSARLLCRRHNDQHARETFGEAFMKSKKPKRVEIRVTASSGGRSTRPLVPSPVMKSE